MVRPEDFYPDDLRLNPASRMGSTHEAWSFFTLPVALQNEMGIHVTDYDETPDI